MRRISVLILCLLFAAGLFAEEVTFESKEEKEKKIAETIQMYEEGYAGSRLDGNIEAFYQLSDSLGKGFVKLDFDVTLQINDFNNIKSDRFEVSVKGKDDMGYKFEKSFSVKRSKFYISPEGYGLLVKKLSIEKGTYYDLTLSVTGNKGESVTAAIPEYKTIDMNSTELNIKDPVFIYSLNTVKEKQFYKSGMYIVPTLNRYYDKSRAVGFYFEYYHLAEKDRSTKGEYSMNYALIHELSQIEIFSDVMDVEDAPLEGNQQIFLDLSSATPGIYNFKVVFTDKTSGVKSEFERLFRIAEKETETEEAE